MHKFLETLVEIISWIQVMLAPVVLSSLIVGIVWAGQGTWAVWMWVVLGVGLLAGIALAEWVRRRYGCHAFLSRVYGGGN